MDLVLGQSLAGSQVEQDRAGRVARGEDLRQPLLEIKCLEVPAVQR